MASNPFENFAFQDPAVQAHTSGQDEEASVPAAVGTEANSTGAWGGSGAGSWASGVFGGGKSKQAEKKTNVAEAADKGTSREQELSKREKALESREVELQRWEQQLKRSADQNTSTVPPANVRTWPPFFPIIHYDLNNEVPQDKRGMVRLGFYGFLMVVIALVYNFFGVSWYLIENGDEIVTWFLALIYLVAGIPGAWFLWMKGLYKGAVYNSTFSYIWFFTFNGLNVAFCAWSATSPFNFPGAISDQYAHTGFIPALKIFDDNKVLGLVYLVGAVWWGLTGLAGVYNQSKVCLVYRGVNPDLGAAEIKREAIRAAANNI